jgi:hypothetical protein
MARCFGKMTLRVNKLWCSSATTIHRQEEIMKIVFYALVLVGLAGLFACNSSPQAERQTTTDAISELTSGADANGEVTQDVTFNAAPAGSSNVFAPTLIEHEDIFMLELRGTTRSGKTFKALVLSSVNTPWAGRPARLQVRVVNAKGVQALVGTVASAGVTAAACTTCLGAGIVMVDANTTLTEPVDPGPNYNLKDVLVTSFFRSVSGLNSEAEFAVMKTTDGKPFAAGVGLFKPLGTVSSQGLLSSPMGLSATGQTINTIIGTVGKITGTLKPLDGNTRDIIGILIGL